MGSCLFITVVVIVLVLVTAATAVVVVESSVNLFLGHNQTQGSFFPLKKFKTKLSSKSALNY